MSRSLLGWILVFALASTFTGCWCEEHPARSPEECKVTTDPEACRKATEHH